MINDWHRFVELIFDYFIGIDYLCFTATQVYSVNFIFQGRNWTEPNRNENETNRDGKFQTFSKWMVEMWLIQSDYLKMFSIYFARHGNNTKLLIHHTHWMTKITKSMRILWNFISFCGEKCLTRVRRNSHVTATISNGKCSFCTCDKKKFTTARIIMLIYFMLSHSVHMTDDKTWREQEVGERTLPNSIANIYFSQNVLRFLDELF